MTRLIWWTLLAIIGAAMASKGIPGDHTDLGGANLGDANLRGAVADKFTVWPDRFDHAARGVTIR